jgi:flagellar L-ring protein precursor FlgH
MSTTKDTAPQACVTAKVALLSVALAGIAGCSAVDRVENLGAAPALAPIAQPAPPAYQPVTMATEQAPPGAHQANSLWAPGSRSFFHDPRASHVGDIITIDITIADGAKLSDTTSRSRTNSDDANLTNFFGLESKLQSILPGADPTSLVKMGSDTSNVGAGAIDRSEDINLTLAGIVTQVLPNGNLVVSGHQQVRVNLEMRDLQIGGIVRTEDITSDNTINLSQIAEARVSYGGQGQITDVQQPRYGSQLFDILMPF